MSNIRIEDLEQVYDHLAESIDHLDAENVSCFWSSWLYSVQTRFKTALYF